MKMKRYAQLSLVPVLLSSPLPLLAGSLDSPAPPTDAGSAMFTIEDIYNRLNDGTPGAKRTGAFTEPTSGPTAGTGYTLDEVMGIAPLINANGATPAEVLAGKVFWGLVSGNWGLLEGTATAGANVTGTDGNLVMTIPDGLYSSKTATASDTNLTAANVKSGVTIFGIAGTHTGIGGNIQDTSSGDATAAEIATGKKAWVDGSEITGNVSAGSNVAGADGNLVMTIPDGLYSSSKTATASDADLTATNIKSGVSVFGVAWTYTGIGGNVQDTSSGDATASEIVSGKKAWVDGVEVVGTATIPSCTPTTVNPVFTDNNDGTVTDNRTCLMWLKDASCAYLAGTDSNGQADWNTAKTAASSLANGTCGLTDNSNAGDWHLPTIQELQSLVHRTFYNPAMSNATGDAKWSTDGDAFSGVQTNLYWSSTTARPGPAWNHRPRRRGQRLRGGHGLCVASADNRHFNTLDALMGVQVVRLNFKTINKIN